MTSPNNPLPNPHLDALLAEAGWVLKLAKRLARDQAAAEDIAQSTLALALEKRPPADGGLRPWLAKVAGRLARHRVRSETRRAAREDFVTSSRSSQSAASDEALIRFELQQDLGQRVAALPEPYRRTLILRFYEGLSIQEIAKATSVPSSTVRSQLARGLERIRLQYNDQPEHRSALGIFLFAADSSTNFITRRAAEMALMQTSTKLAIAGAVALIAAATFLPTYFAQPELPQLDSAVVAVVPTQPMAVESAEVSQVHEPAEEARRVAVATDRPSAESAPLDEDVMPDVSTLRVRILGQNRMPLAGATLSSIYPDGRPRGTSSVGRSDFEGRVVLELRDDAMRKWRDDVLDMTFAIAAAEHGTEFVITAPTLHGDTDLGDVQLGPGGSIAGRTVDTAGLGVAGAVLYAGASEAGADLGDFRVTGPTTEVSRPRAVSAEDGSFLVTGIAAELDGNDTASVRLFAQAPGGLWTMTEPIAITPRGRFDAGRILLEEAPKAQRLEGVVYGPHGLPASGARVDFASTGAPHTGHVVADVNGAFTVIPKSDAPMELVASDAREELGASHSQFAKRGDHIELRLLVRRQMTLTVTDTNGAPIVDAHIMPVLADSSGQEGRLVPGEAWKHSDEFGRVTIEVPGQLFKVVVRKYGAGVFDQGPFEPSSAPATLGVTIPVVYEVVGRVLAYGVPVPFAEVYVMRRLEGFAAMTGGFPNRYGGSSPTVIADAEGRFVAPVKLDWPALGVVARKKGFAAGEATPELVRGDKIRGVEVHMTEGGVIEGVVTPPPNMAAGGLYVGASRGDGIPMSTRADAMGRYRFEGLTPGNWRVEGRLREVRTELLSTSDRDDDMDPKWNAFVEDRQTLELDLDMSGFVDVQVRGRLLIDGAVPLPGWRAEVVLPTHARGPEEVDSVPLDSDGRFTLKASQGRADLRLVGPALGGATIEVVREIHFEGTHLDWEETLLTDWVEDSLEGGFKRARFVHGDRSVGDREITIVPLGRDGSFRARVPVGTSVLEVDDKNDTSGRNWDFLKRVEIQ